MFSAVEKYVKENYISFHTPAHQGRNEIINKILRSEYDLTELDETDNLFSPDGIIKQAQEEAAGILGFSEAFILPNGATSGIMSAFSVFSENDIIIMDRNAHISAVNAVIANGLRPVFVKPEFDSEFGIPKAITAEAVEEALNRNPEAAGVFITSATYYGLVCDLEKISSVCKKHKVVLISDEAHMSHHYFEDNFINGADISILSLHKNIPGLTQCGMLGVRNSALSAKIKKALRFYTSTSPSYLLTVSSFEIIKFMRDNKQLIGCCKGRTEKVKNSLRKISGLEVLECDFLRIVINLKNFDIDNRIFLENLKNRYRIVPEMTDGVNTVFIISIHNTKEELDILENALYELLENTELRDKIKKLRDFKLPSLALLPKIAYNRKSETVKVKDAAGRISGETVIKFPPSVPVLVCGELIDKEHIPILAEDYGIDEIEVVKDAF